DFAAVAKVMNEIPELIEQKQNDDRICPYCQRVGLYRWDKTGGLIMGISKNPYLLACQSYAASIFFSCPVLFEALNF
ncbi:MAG: hypothetical protein RQ714_09485, partial [Nitrosomonas sp.]|nr:hypothetical protein [Nitrosomonas sp.]